MDARTGVWTTTVERDGVPLLLHGTGATAEVLRPLLARAPATWPAR